MAQDLLYIFHKNTNVSSVLGEIQSDFNMSLVIDGTKDSTSMLVMSFSQEEEIEPMSIILHMKTATWWVVSHDKVERLQNDDGSFLWIHNLELLGAIELFNSRDLTDCGFNDNTYTVNDFIYRLFSLSNIEDLNLIVNAQNNFKNKTVDFIKTFENYTLLSALREFLDAYNMCPKLSFNYVFMPLTRRFRLTDIVLDIIPKTGNRNRTHLMTDFDDVRETKTMDKNSFGTTVVSNAENVASSNAKTFPSAGSVKLSGTEYTITNANAVLRLPSKVYKMNWLKCLATIELTLILGTGESQDTYTIKVNVSSDFSIENVKTQVHSYINATSHLTPSQKVEAILSFDNSWESLKAKIIKSGTISFYGGNSLNPVTGAIVEGDDVPYIPLIWFSIGDTGADWHQVVLADEETRNCLPHKEQGIYWERGSNLVKGFDFIKSKLSIGSAYEFSIEPHNSTDLQNESAAYWEYVGGPNDYVLARFTGNFTSLKVKLADTTWIANYQPMSDIKIKVDNSQDKRDIQLYNQNGRITDCVALSKLLNSYSKEISSDTITKYMHYYSYEDVPQVGDIVTKNNDIYVINNISMDFTQNESSEVGEFDYFIECEITMSKWFSTKSLMVNPNTNIRDYGIPQNFNVKRKQLYRDYYELSYIVYVDSNLDTPYLNTEKVFVFNHDANELIDFICVIKLGYEEEVEGENYWYYQLETTTYYMNKMVYVMLDFQDNNIIGYGSQNVWSGFDVSRIFSGLTDNLNTPIEYTDKNGKVDTIDILMCTNQQLTTIYNEYQFEQQGGDSYDGLLYNYSVFIPADIYNKALDNYSIRIEEDSYQKDATEVPVFEYACQVEDSNDVLIGDNILSQHPGFIYFYSYVFGENINQNNAFTTTRVANDGSIYEISLGCEISYDDYTNEVKVGLYNKVDYNRASNTWLNGQKVTFREGDDYAFFRHAYNLETGEEIVELLFIAKKVDSDYIDENDKLILKVNHYKLNKGKINALLFLYK